MNKFFNQNRTKKEALEIYKQRIEDAKIIFEKFHETFLSRNCPYCDSKDYTEEEKFIGLYEVARCSFCSSKYIRLVPSNEALIYYYNECKCNLMLDDLFRKRAHLGKGNVVNRGKLDEVLRIIKMITEKNNDKDGDNDLNILEIGCGSGSFLTLLQESLDERKIAANLFGIDLDKNAISKISNDRRAGTRNVVGRSNLVGASEALRESESVGASIGCRITLQVGGAETFVMKERFDLIIHFELIEHLINPSRMMGNIYLHLKPNGYSFFTTPNSLGLEIKAIPYNKIRYLAHSIFPPMHINAFNPQNLTHFLLKNGFKIKEIKTPGIFDISILLSTAEDESLDIKPITDRIKAYDDETLETIQQIVSYLHGSSHMTCLIQK